MICSVHFTEHSRCDGVKNISSIFCTVCEAREADNYFSLSNIISFLCFLVFEQSNWPNSPTEFDVLFEWDNNSNLHGSARLSFFSREWKAEGLICRITNVLGKNNNQSIHLRVFTLTTVTNSLSGLFPRDYRKVYFHEDCQPYSMPYGKLMLHEKDEPNVELSKSCSSYEASFKCWHRRPTFLCRSHKMLYRA